MNTLLRPAILALLMSAISAAHALAPTNEFIRRCSEAILEDSHGLVAGQRVASTSLLPDFYARRGFRPVWTTPARFRELLELLRSAEWHGLDTDDYHYRTLVSLVNVSGHQQAAERDVLATDALIRFGYHLHLGKVDPARLDPDWNLNRRLNAQEPIDLLEQAASAPSLSEFFATRLAPRGLFYTGLRAALARYREFAAAGGWPPVPSGPSLSAGDRGPRVEALRARLAATDPALAADAPDPTLFDAELGAALQRFQRQHGLDPDGVVGPRTIDALNVPVEARIDQLRVNLERTRWVFNGLEPRFLVVNIAGFEAYLSDSGEIIWRSRVQVGKPYRQTPVFKDEMTYLVFSPTWTVPPTILEEDVIPQIKQDPSYLTDRNMVLLDRTGQPVDISTIDMSSISADSFPYTVRQEPGPKNALGRIKFMFPNKHFVYLHDTPSRRLFNRAERTTSSGCIRVEKPISLATILLDDPLRWNRKKIKEKIAQARNETVGLKKPITVYLMYWTSALDEAGNVRFFNDIYGRDQAVLEGLRQPFRFDP